MLPIIFSPSQFDVAMIDVTALSVKTGLVSALLVLPAVLSISFLFRLREIELTHSETHQKKYTSEGEIQQQFPPEKLYFLLSTITGMHLSWQKCSYTGGK